MEGRASGSRELCKELSSRRSHYSITGSDRTAIMVSQTAGRQTEQGCQGVGRPHARRCIPAYAYQVGEMVREPLQAERRLSGGGRANGRADLVHPRRDNDVRYPGIGHLYAGLYWLHCKQRNRNTAA